MLTTKPTTAPERERVKPLPEIVDAKHRLFTVTEHINARVSLQDPCLFQAPLGTERYLQDGRAHELAHIRWTPTDKTATQYAADANVPEPYLQACEDYRVNALAAQHNVKLEWLSNPAGMKEHLQRTVENAPVDWLACFAVARAGARSESALIDRVFNESPKGQAALKLASVVKDIIRSRMLAETSIQAAVAGAEYLVSVFNTAKALSESPLDMGAYDMPPLDLSDMDTLIGVLGAVGKIPGFRAATRWGKMHIINPPRFTPCATFVKGFRPRATDAGLLPVAVHRLPVDGLIFKQKAKSKYGGAVLIDMSGSMHLPFEKVTQWLRRKPLATVAVYSGDDHDGYLTILAKNGLRTDDANAHPENSGNIIDGPALRWLACQPGPRAWVSDGATTGIGDRGYGYAECGALCAVHRIEQIRFSMLAKGEWPPKP